MLIKHGDWMPLGRAEGTVLEALGLTEVAHDAKDNRMRAIWPRAGRALVSLCSAGLPFDGPLAHHFRPRTSGWRPDEPDRRSKQPERPECAAERRPGQPAAPTRGAARGHARGNARAHAD